MARRPRTVAIVEDDSSMRRSIQRLLNAHGFATETFLSAEALLASDPHSRLGCVVLDIHLPTMSGLDLLRHLIAAGSTMPVIFVTAIEDDTIRMAAAQLGCIAYLRKPFPGASLISAVSEALSASPKAEV